MFRQPLELSIMRTGVFLALLVLAGACTAAQSRNAPDTALPGEAVPIPPISTLDVLQFNVQFATPWNPGTSFGPIALPDTLDAQYWPNTESRARAIGLAIACYDIVVLNETTNEERIGQILEAMEAAASACRGRVDRTVGPGYFNVVHGPVIKHNMGDILAGRQKNVLANLSYLIGHFKDIRNGLAARVDQIPREPLTDDSVTIISRLPIIETNSTIYQNRSGADAFGAKGVLHARLARGSGTDDAIDVFATHLQASGGANMRQAQLEELASFIDQHTDPETPVLLLGDFNIPGPYTRTVLIDGVPVARAVEPHINYRDIQSMLLKGLGFQDIGQVLPEGTNVERREIGDVEPNAAPGTCQDNPATTGVDEGRASYCQRIDYIFVAPRGHRLAVQEVKVEKFAHSAWKDLPTLSDHAAISARLQWHDP